MTHDRIRRLTVIAMLGATTIVLGLTPLGFIPIPPAKATTMHIPVIIGALMEGPVVGLCVGLLFGLFSLLQAIMSPTILSPVFLNPLVSVLPRLLIGPLAYYTFRLLSKVFHKQSFGDKISWGVAALIGTLVNTCGVLTMMGVTAAGLVSEAMSITKEAVFGVLVGIGVTNGPLECVAAIILVVIIMGALTKVKQKKRTGDRA